MSKLLDFNPSAIGEHISPDSPTGSPSATSAEVTSKLEGIAKQLETPIKQLVDNYDGIRSALEAISDHLPSRLKQVLQPTAHLGFLHEEVLAQRGILKHAPINQLCGRK